MRHGRLLRRTALVGALLIMAVALQGCNYLQHRVDDMVQLFDLGLTLTKTPQFSFYMNCPTIIPIGYGKIDGYYLGAGDNREGLTPIKRESVGLLFWGREKSTDWKHYDPAKEDVLSVRDVGVVGLALSKDIEKSVVPYCIHYVHVGWVGFVWNINWFDFPDFFLGFAGLDPMGDDGPNGGWWFGRSGKTAVAKASTTEDVLPLSTQIAGMRSELVEEPKSCWSSWLARLKRKVSHTPEPASTHVATTKSVTRTPKPASARTTRNNSPIWWPWRRNTVIDLSPTWTAKADTER